MCDGIDAMNVFWQPPIVLGQVWREWEQTEMLAQYLEPILGQPASDAYAGKLLKYFGSLPAVIRANAEQIRLVGPCEDKVISHLHLMHQLSVHLAVGKVVLGQPIMSNWPALFGYLQAQMAGEHTEHFRVLYLNKRLHLIADKLLAVGTIDHVFFPTVEIAKTALMLNASELILVHNHPSGEPQPSLADLQSTKALVEILAPLRIRVYDHFIIGKLGHMSLRGAGYFSHPAMLSDAELEKAGLVELERVLAGGTTRERRPKSRKAAR